MLLPKDINEVITEGINCTHPQEYVQVLAKTGGWFGHRGRVEWCSKCGRVRTTGTASPENWATHGVLVCGRRFVESFYK